MRMAMKPRVPAGKGTKLSSEKEIWSLRLYRELEETSDRVQHLRAKYEEAQAAWETAVNSAKNFRDIAQRIANPAQFIGEEIARLQAEATSMEGKRNEAKKTFDEASRKLDDLETAKSQLGMK
jgi:chromosome segregation ATPase